MNTKFDKEFQTIYPPLFMLPWIGEHYETKRVFFIGESDYDDGARFHSDWKRNWICQNRIDSIGNVKILNNIDRDILTNVTKEKQIALWDSITYLNLVQRPMDYNNGKREIPNYEDFFNGWKSILETCLILKPKVILKWGIAGDGVLRKNLVNKEYKNWQVETINNNIRFLKLNHDNGFSTKILIVKHPSYNSAKRKEIILANLPEVAHLNS
jgi:hypothetical protein